MLSGAERSKLVWDQDPWDHVFWGARPWGHRGSIFGPNYRQFVTRNYHDHVSGPLQSFLEDVTRIEEGEGNDTLFDRAEHGLGSGARTKILDPSFAISWPRGRFGKHFRSVFRL